MEQKKKYAYPLIGAWLKAIIKEWGVTNDLLIVSMEMSKPMFYDLLKGGYEVQLLGASVLHRYGFA